MLKLAVCDDEKVFRSDLKRILATELELCGIDYHITEFASGEALIAGLEKTDCQLLFLDIEMKGMDGVAAARKLREMKRQMEIIFVTSYADFVFQGYEVRALNYILKPYEPERIAAVLHTALEALDIEAEKYYVIEQKGGSIRVPLSTVKYFSSDRRTVHAVTTDREYTFYEKLSDLEAELPDTFVTDPQPVSGPSEIPRRGTTEYRGGGRGRAAGQPVVQTGALHRLCKVHAAVDRGSERRDCK